MDTLEEVIIAIDMITSLLEVFDKRLDILEPQVNLLAGGLGETSN